MPGVPASISRSAPPAWRPDRSLGVFETVLVLDGRPVELDAHLARLEASLTALYPGRTLPPLDVPSPKRPYGSIRDGTFVEALRIAVAPGAGGGLTPTLERRRAAGRFAPDNGGELTSEAVSLRSLTLRGGLGAHKWADRSLLDEAQANLADDTIPLIVDADGAVLEASRANVFVVRDGTLGTPPADGRILAGVTRMRVLEIAAGLGIDIEETRVSHDDLLGADEVFLTGSVRGIEPARRLDGAPLAGGGEIAGRIARALRRSWAGAETAPEFG